MEIIENYIEANKDRFVEELFGLMRIPSVSSIKDHKPDMYKAAEYWKTGSITKQVAFFYKRMTGQDAESVDMNETIELDK